MFLGCCGFWWEWMSENLSSESSASLHQFVKKGEEKTVFKDNTFISSHLAFYCVKPRGATNPHRRSRLRRRCRRRLGANIAGDTAASVMTIRTVVAAAAVPATARADVAHRRSAHDCAAFCSTLSNAHRR